MNYPAYSQISEATRNLVEAVKITDRRLAVDALKELLSDGSFRAQLTQESAAADKDRPTYALRITLCNTVKAALRVSGKIIDSKTKKKTKKSVEDVVLPFKIFCLVDKDSDVAIAALKKERQTRFDECEPFTFESFDRYRNTNANLTHISSKEIGELLKYCLACLKDQELCDLAEADFLKMLQRLCSRPDYVVHFHPFQDVLDILTVVRERLQSGNDGALSAASAFYNLIHQFTTALDIQINECVQMCLAIIVDWVRDCKSNSGSAGGNNSSQLIKFMYGVATDLLSVYPEQCVTILSQRDFGKELFGYARRCWKGSRAGDRDMLVGYFASHL